MFRAPGRKTGTHFCWARSMDAEIHPRTVLANSVPSDVRRMFGGQGVFVDGRMIALISREVIHLKADAETIPEFEREGLGPFTYAKKDGEHKLTSYWRMPERLYDDPEELAQWARRAHCRRDAGGCPKRKSQRKRRSRSGDLCGRNRSDLRIGLAHDAIAAVAFRRIEGVVGPFDQARNRNRPCGASRPRPKP